MDPIVNFVMNNDIDGIRESIALHPLKYTVLNHALKLCAHYGKKAIADLLLFKNKNVVIEWKFLIKLATVSNQPAMLRLFISYGAIVTYDNDHALKIACCNGYYEIAEILIRAGANVKTDHNYPLQVAASNGHNDVVKLLIDNMANIHDNNNHALVWANMNNHQKTVELLLDHGANKSTIENLITRRSYVINIYATETTFKLIRTIIDNKTNTIISIYQQEYFS